MQNFYVAAFFLSNCLFSTNLLKTFTKRKKNAFKTFKKPCLNLYIKKMPCVLPIHVRHKWNLLLFLI